MVNKMSRLFYIKLWVARIWRRHMVSKSVLLYIEPPAIVNGSGDGGRYDVSTVSTVRPTSFCSHDAPVNSSRQCQITCCVRASMCATIRLMSLANAEATPIRISPLCCVATTT